MGGTIMVGNLLSSCNKFHLNCAEQKSLNTQKWSFDLNSKATLNPSVLTFITEIASRVNCLFINC